MHENPYHESGGHKKKMHELCKKYMHKLCHVQMNDGNSFYAYIDHLDNDHVYVTVPAYVHGNPNMLMSHEMAGFHQMPMESGMPMSQHVSPPGASWSPDDMDWNADADNVRRGEERVWGWGWGYPWYGYGPYGYGGIRRWILPLAAIAALSLAF